MGWFAKLVVNRLTSGQKTIIHSNLYIVLFFLLAIEHREMMMHRPIPLLGLCRGCVLGTFSTWKSGMSPIILAVGANVPTYLRFMNGNITEVTPEKLTTSPYFSMVWVICPHFSKTLAEHCFAIAVCGGSIDHGIVMSHKHVLWRHFDQLSTERISWLWNWSQVFSRLRQVNDYPSLIQPGYLYYYYFFFSNCLSLS